MAKGVTVVLCLCTISKFFSPFPKNGSLSAIMGCNSWTYDHAATNNCHQYFIHTASSYYYMYYKAVISDEGWNLQETMSVTEPVMSRHPK